MNHRAQTVRKVLAAVVAVAAFVVVTATPASAADPVSLWSDTDTPGTIDVDDPSAVELGTRFRAAVDGTVTGVRFYKSAANTGTHTGSLWTEDGDRLAQLTFSNETASGWQTATFATPVPITANRFYIVSYHTTTGHYSADNNGFAQARDNGPLHAPADTPEKSNGLFRYGSGGFPTSTFAATNYWVDVTFTPTTTTPEEPPVPGGFPNEANTGVPAGVTLTPFTEPCKFHTDNQVIDGKIVDCTDGIQVYAANVTFRNSIIKQAVETNAGGASITIVDSEVRAGATSRAAVSGTDVTVLRSEITGGQHSVRCDNDCLVQDSYLHDQFNDPDSSFGYHNNGFLSNGGTGMVLRHNTLWCSPPDNEIGGGCSTNLSLFGDFEPITDVTVENNYFHATPGGYCGSFGYNPGKNFGDNPTGVVVRDNVFERGPSGRCGGVGPATSFLTTGPGNLWSGNTWSDGGPVDPA
ncbi:DUF4082 domain-containing protein [Actinoplanes xinjiangensis]|uniref:DUF4082 domain-containing protein n=1 Tax=Actinoplanes xinjiangensis TaxID=512350 RepID=UPI0034357C84